MATFKWNGWQLWSGIRNQLGISGETTDSLIGRVSVESSPRRPHLLILYPGFNDIRRENSSDSNNVVPLEAFRSSMETLVDRAMALAPTLILTGFPFDDSKTTPYLDTNWYYLRSDAKRYTQTLKDICEARSLSVLDYFELWESRILDELLAPDGLHCNPKGHQLLFEQLRDFLEMAYKGT